MLAPLLLAGLLAAATAAEATVLNVQIEPQQELCFHEDLLAGDELEAMVLVYRGGKLDIKLRIDGPDGLVKYEKLHYSNLDDTTGAALSAIVKKGTKLQVDAPGAYTICMDNRMARWTAKVGTLELTVRSGAGAAGSLEGVAAAALGADATDSQKAAQALQELKGLASRVHHKLVAIENAQYFHYHRETAHRDTAESTNSRVAWWSVAEAAVVLAFTAGQVLVVRTWFSGAAGSRRGGAMLPRGASGV